ncbi:7635_t:CDS:1, partial [Cetraspora pellucida]
MIYINSIHNTNYYKYALFTILIQYPYSSYSVLLAWLLTKSQDFKTIKVWLHALKENGWVNLKNVMLDNDNAEINMIQ